MGEAVSMSTRGTPAKLEAEVRNELHLSPTSAVLLSDATPSSQKHSGNHKIRSENIDWNNISSPHEIYHPKNHEKERQGSFDKHTENQQDVRVREVAVSRTVRAASDGDFQELQKAVGLAYKNMQGDEGKLTAYADQLSKSLKSDGIEAKYKNGSMQFHKQGDQNAVTMQPHSALSHSTGDIVTTVESFASNPKNGEKVADDAATITKLFSKEASEVKSVKELAADWKNASEGTHDYSKINVELLAALKDAYYKGGTGAVENFKLSLHGELGLEMFTEKEAPHILGESLDDQYRIVNGRRYFDYGLKNMLASEPDKKHNIESDGYHGYIDVTSHGYTLPKKPEVPVYHRMDEFTLGPGGD